MKKKIIIGLSIGIVICVFAFIYSYVKNTGKNDDLSAEKPTVILNADTTEENTEETASFNIITDISTTDTSNIEKETTVEQTTEYNGISFTIEKEITKKQEKTTTKTKVKHKKINKPSKANEKITTKKNSNYVKPDNSTITKANSKPKQTKPKVTKPVIKPLGTYYESNSLGGGKISVIKNSIMSKIGGSKNSEKMNLARYMSAHGLANATSVYKSLTNSNKNFSTRTSSVSIESDSNSNIVKAANKLAGSLSASGSYGMGVSSYRSGVGYRIYVVIVY